MAYLRDPELIYQQSFSAIRKEADLSHFPQDIANIVVRMIHSCGMTDIVATEHPEIQFVKASYLNDHPLVLDTFSERVEEIRNGVNNMNCKLCK